MDVGGETIRRAFTDEIVFTLCSSPRSSSRETGGRFEI
jgi:hypothetical protein